MSVDLNAKVNLNTFYDKARDDIASLIGGVGVKASVIFNDTDQAVTFKVYNYVDTVYLIPAQSTLAAPQTQAVVAASGVYFKILPEGNKAHEFLVAPGKAYVYRGPGNIESL